MTRTNIVLDEVLVGKVKNMTGLKTTRQVVDLALKELARHRRQRDILKLKGAISWEGDLSQSRKGRHL